MEGSARTRSILKYVHPGDHVRVVYGSKNDQKTAIGKILEWDDDFLALQKSSERVSQICIDDIRAIEHEEDEEPVSDVPKIGHGLISVKETQSVQKAVPLNSEYRVLRQMVNLKPGQPYLLNAEECINCIKEELKESENGKFKNEINSIISSFSSALNVREIKYKYHNLRARVMNTWDMCEKSSEYHVFYFLLGVMAIAASDYDYSYEPLVRARKFMLASYAASKGKKPESEQVFSLCAVLSGESCDINQFISEACILRRDADTLKKLLEMYRNDPEQCEKIASCAYMMFLASKGRLKENITPYLSAYETAEKLFGALPENWKSTKTAVSYWNEFNEYHYPISSAKEEEDDIPHKGFITKFNQEQKWGFISHHDYFYIEQVRDDTTEGILLRKMLYAGIADHIEVTYRLGQSPLRAENNAAYSVELTAEGYKNALKMLKENTVSTEQKGFISEFYANSETGKIISGKKTYSFQIQSIADPFLKAYYCNSFSIHEQRVRFRIAGKKAVDICWLDPDEQDKEAYANTVSQKEKEQWQQFLQEKNHIPAPVIPEQDPYAGYRYKNLYPTGRASGKAKTPPLSWGREKNLDSVNASGPDTGTKTPEPPSQPKKGNSSSKVKAYTDAARLAMKEDRIEEAEMYFDKALHAGGFNESVVCDYISLHMRPTGNIDKAVDLIEHYSKDIPAEKLINLRIQVYDKKKDYETLCPLYETAFRQTGSIAKKSHILYRLIDAYIKQKKYSEALEACKRWESLYSQNQYSPDIEKLKKAVSNVNRQKAVCFYHLGHTEEARKIATNLIRSNPADTAANRILDGTLDEKDTTAALEDTGSGVMDLDDSNDEAEDSDSLITRFVRNLISQTDIADSLKSSNIKDGEYIGTKEQGMEDVRKLTGRKSRTGKMRSEDLLAACKLLDQIEQHYGYHSVKKCRLSGRAMASWGDSMVSQSNQLDTPRMAYLYALKILTPTSRGMEQDWYNAYNRYLRSYFMAQTGNNSLEEYIANQNTLSGPEGANSDILIGNKIQVRLMPEFVVGILMLIRAISNQRDRMKTLTENIYNKNAELRKSICSQLTVYFPAPVSMSPTLTEFRDILQKAVDILQEKHNKLSRLIFGISRTLLLEPSQEFCDGICEKDWKDFLTHTDLTRLNQISYIVRRSQDYFNSSNFENRSECLRDIMSKVRDLLKSISTEPTDISYDIYLPALEQIQSNVTDTQTKLYHDFLPSISLSETIQPFRTNSGIQIQLTVRNENNYQLADSLSIVDVRGDDVIKWTRPNVIQTLRGGDEAEIGLLVSISDMAVTSGSFSATIVLEYKCSDSPQNIITKNQETEFNFIIHDENFEKLKNPFEGYIGKVMDRDDLFVGRDAQIHSIINKILPDGVKNYGRAIAMYGQTRTGKSSIMLHLANELQKNYSDSVIVWDMENIGNLLITDAASLLHTILEKGQEEINENERLASILAAQGIAPQLDKILEDDKHAAIYFNEYMRQLNRVLKEENKIIVLMIDEFTYLHDLIRKKIMSDKFMHFWKAMLQNYCIFAVIAGQDDMPEFMREYPNDFACMELLKLTYLEENDAKLLIRKVEEVNGKSLFRTNDSVEELYEITAGSAYLIVLLCSYLVDYLNEKGAYIITKGIINEFLRTKALGPKACLTSLNFEAQLQERGHEELNKINEDILTAIARLSQTTGYANIDNIHCDGVDDDDIRKYVERLVDRNVLVKEGRDRYRIQVKLLEHWLIDTKGV